MENFNFYHESLKFSKLISHGSIHFCQNTTREREGKDLPSEIQARGEVVLFKLAKKRLILWRKMEETCGEGRETNLCFGLMKEKNE